MRFCCISDTHGDEAALGNLPPADVLVHGGDFAFFGRPATVAAFEAWGQRQPQDRHHKLVVLGNHENRFVQDDAVDELRAALPSFTLLVNETVAVDGLVVYGAPFYPDHCSEDQHAAHISSEVDVVLTHNPPKGCHDGGQGHVALAKAVSASAPKLHVFGHIHGAYGTATNPETRCVKVNAAMVGGIGGAKKRSERKCQHKRPIVVDVDVSAGGGYRGCGWRWRTSMNSIARMWVAHQHQQWQQRRWQQTTQLPPHTTTNKSRCETALRDRVATIDAPPLDLAAAFLPSFDCR